MPTAAESTSRAGCPARPWVLVLVLVPLLCGASHRSANFVVHAPSPELAREVAEHAEHFRKSIARSWLGQEIPRWSRPCVVRVKLTGGEPGGLTSFSFGAGRVVDQEMTVEGRRERILASALPHEVTHTIFAHFFGGPMPRWADEGAALLSEDHIERGRHDEIAQRLLARRASLPLKALFTAEEYPPNIMDFYGQGYSVSRFLVEQGGRPRFLRFIREGMAKGWDVAARTHYEIADTRELDRAWRAWHKVVASDAPTTGPARVVRAQSPSTRR